MRGHADGLWDFATLTPVPCMVALDYPISYSLKRVRATPEALPRKPKASKVSEPATYPSTPQVNTFRRNVATKRNIPVATRVMAGPAGRLKWKERYSPVTEAAVPRAAAASMMDTKRPASR